jgi:4-amino-4-deoxy-L-arabinose transferase-like glycosyltransferase
MSTKPSCYQIICQQWQKHKYFFSFLLLIILAIILRLPFLSIFPPAMVQDEVGLGYSAISIAETGKDEWGETYPLLFKSFGEYKLPVFVYVTAILYKIIGWQQVLPRITSALAGVILVFLTVLWVRQLTKSKKLALLAGLILATSPWTIHLSRMALESNLALVFFMAALLMISSQKSSLKVILAAIFFSLSSYTYNAYKYLVILFLTSYIVGILLFYYKKITSQKQLLKNLLAILLISSCLSLLIFFAKGTTVRLDQTFLLNSEQQLGLYKHYENNCHLALNAISPRLNVLCRLQYNKFSRAILIVVDSYTKHLSPGFYFFSGDSEPGRNPTQTGQFYAPLLVFCLFGVVTMIKNPKKYLLIIVGFLTALLPSAVSGNPHAIRLSAAIPFVLLMIIWGYQSVQKLILRKKLFDWLFVLLILLSTIFYSIKYMASTYVAWENTGTYLSFAKKIAKLSYDYAERGYVVYADFNLYPEPHIYYAYWNKIDPLIAQQSFVNVLNEADGFSRPRQFGDQVFFEKGDTDLINCQSDTIPLIVYFRKEPISGVQAVQIIRDNANIYDFAYVYESWQFCSIEN